VDAAHMENRAPIAAARRPRTQPSEKKRPLSTKLLPKMGLHRGAEAELGRDDTASRVVAVAAGAAPY
jgi:hypothetical protein